MYRSISVQTFIHRARRPAAKIYILRRDRHKGLWGSWKPHPTRRVDHEDPVEIETSLNGGQPHQSVSTYTDSIRYSEFVGHSSKLDSVILKTRPTHSVRIPISPKYIRTVHKVSWSIPIQTSGRFSIPCDPPIVYPSGSMALVHISARVTVPLESPLTSNATHQRPRRIGAGGA